MRPSEVVVLTVEDLLCSPIPPKAVIFSDFLLTFAMSLTIFLFARG